MEDTESFDSKDNINQINWRESKFDRYLQKPKVMSSFYQ